MDRYTHDIFMICLIFSFLGRKPFGALGRQVGSSQVPFSD